MEHEILDLIDRYWKFDNDQTPVSNWHDKQDLLDAVRKALLIHDVVGRSEQLVAILKTVKGITIPDTDEDIDAFVKQYSN